MNACKTFCISGRYLTECKEHFSMLCHLLSCPCVYWVDGSFVLINDDVRSEIRETIIIWHLLELSHPPYHLNLQPVLQRS